MGAAAEGSGPSTACSMLGGNDGNDEDGDCRCNSGASGGGRWSGDGSAITSIGAGGIDPGGSREGEGEATSDRAGRHRCGRHREVVAGHGRDSLLCGAPERVLDADGVAHAGIAFDDLKGSPDRFPRIFPGLKGGIPPRNQLDKGLVT